MQIYLASQSPRRRQLLEQVGVAFRVVDVDVDEKQHDTERPVDYVQRLAEEKAQAGLQACNNPDDSVVIGADTAVVLDDVVLGKATSCDHAVEMLKFLSGRLHHVYTAVALFSSEQQQVITSKTAVCFKNLSETEIDSYCATGEPLGKAGGYAIQGRAAVFVESIRGSYSGVVGLPLYETWQLLAPYVDQPDAAERMQYPK